jgi:hypothetical protein
VRLRRRLLPFSLAALREAGDTQPIGSAGDYKPHAGFKRPWVPAQTGALAWEKTTPEDNRCWARIQERGEIDMKTAALLTLVLLATPGISQDAVSSPSHAQCRFSDGSTITVTYSPQQRQFRFSTPEALLSVPGVSVPAGDYTASPGRDSHGRWTLTMTKPIARKGLFVLAFPMALTDSPMPAENSGVSFDQTGGSCVMHLSQEKSDTVLSLVFTKKNMDMAVLP